MRHPLIIALMLPTLVACPDAPSVGDPVADATSTDASESAEVARPDDAPATPSDAVSNDAAIVDAVTADAGAEASSAEVVAGDGTHWDDAPSGADVGADLNQDGVTAADAQEGSPDAAPVDSEDTASDADPGGSAIGETCFQAIYDPDENGPDYDQYDPVAAEHCWGTNQQDIVGVQQIVFLGDSVTVGTPNLAHPLSTDNSHFWRNLFAEWSASHFDLDKGNVIEWGFWKSYDYVSGKGGVMQSGAFKNCSKWGARTDDFLEGGGQILECFPSGGSDKKTLVVFTMGGNDINAITELGGEAGPDEVAAGYPEAWNLAYGAVNYLVEAIEYLKDPAHFPNGSHIIFANPFEFTDGTGDVSSCIVAGLTGLKDWAEPQHLEEIVIWILEQFMATAVLNDVDMVWMLEHFCGHGYVATGPSADVDNRCYLGPDTPIWFDETCIHPNDAGHQAIFEMFKATVLE